MNNLLAYRKTKGVTQQDVADYLGMSLSGYSRIESGKRGASTNTLQRLAEYYGITIDSLLGREEPAAITKRQIPVKPAANTTSIPIVGTFRCGYSRNGEEFLQYDNLEIPRSFYDRYGSSLVAYYAVGHSMQPTIFPGDLLYAVLGDAWQDGDIVALVINDAETIKRIRRAPDGGIDICPDNDTYPNTHLTPEDLKLQQVSILARIVRVERDL